ncbi:hypothetical protein SPRG_14413 [Saprolegnia parasitica CBS 223.65]|uniref:Uncharacterized protein n=1 Tax=Saprolegnia parasitica (strain CBS 223.65) TaxID=695850 RepID=A0A067BPV0_SAPPC|nr:hypothetical protein SPRG_14413 [Saprolegnia parasitica CBS 223.65]KDO20278.1 hypothetical protein SPRG_14413 [Saprolegnia parasitica CBS 223.65]|eukprot:XP_012209016.1 hypothetical protein SPRG_14413 [Saprolegnia parasitica CBS 223.65]
MPIAFHRSNLTEDRKRHVYIIARLLHSSASKTALPLLGLAIKMEAQLFVMTHGRALSEDAIRRHLLYLAGRAFRTRFQTRNHVVKL